MSAGLGTITSMGCQTKLHFTVFGASMSTGRQSLGIINKRASIEGGQKAAANG